MADNPATETDLERAASAYCIARGWDPKEQVMWNDGSGRAVCRYRSRRAEVVAMLIEHIAHEYAMVEANKIMVFGK